MPTLNVPQLVPDSLQTSVFTLRPIIPEDAARDFEAVMDSQEYLRGWEQTGWPADDFTVEENRKDLEDLQASHQDGRALTFTVLTPNGVTCLGCVYVFLFVAQVALFARRAMIHDFDIFEPKKAARYLAFRAPKEC